MDLVDPHAAAVFERNQLNAEDRSRPAGRHRPTRRFELRHQFNRLSGTSESERQIVPG